MLRYRSNGLSIHDASWSGVDAESCQMLALEPDSVAFVRSGVLQAHVSGVPVSIDSNHCLTVPQPLLCTPISGHGSCTVFHVEGSFTGTPHTGTGCWVSLSDPVLFLRHWHVLCWTRSRREEVLLIERATRGLLAELQMSFSAEQLARTAHHDALIATIKMKLNADGPAPLLLSRLATLFGMSPFTVSRTFHREVGLSIRHYHKRLRLRSALQHMLESDEDLSSIAMDLGFFDQAHFSNAFRQDFGIPPSLVLAAHRRRTATALSV
ncbi:MAG TPA: AraC family transcriptional regulator [Candidatus Baltobacteraceae bacterium]|nr:AraC family transcriptional regulator [Candidatus Baltobacteraceae bacterium]